MDNLAERLNRARTGGGILFCGAGVSADCLNFKPEDTLGDRRAVTGHLQ